MKRATASSIAIVALLLAAIWFATWQRVRTEADQAIDAASIAQANLAIAFNENAANAIGDVDQALAMLVIEFRATGAASGKVAAQWPVNAALVRGLGVIRADGTKVVALGEARMLFDGTHEAVSHHRAILSRLLHISAPEKLPFTDEWRVAMSRRIDNPDGSLFGIAIAVVDPSFFTDFYGRTDLGARGVVSLLAIDGIEIARRAGALSTFGADMRDSNLYLEATRRRSGTFLSSGRHDGYVRVLSFRRMEHYPLVVMLGTPLDDILAAARERERLYYLLAALVSNIAALVALGFNRAVARERRDFDEITRTQVRLRESEERARAITESMAGGVITTNFDGYVLTVNAAASRMFGYQAGEMVGIHILCLAGKSSHPALLAAIEEAHRQGAGFQSHEQEYLAARKDGTCFEVEVLLSSLSMDGGITYIAIVHDVSGRNAMERVLRSRETRYRATFDQALVGVVYADLASRITEANQTFCEMLGYPPEELLGRTFSDLTHPEDRAASLARIESLIADPTSAIVRHSTKRYLRKDGSTVWVIISISVIARDDGTPDYFLTMVHDITEIKRAEQMKSEFVSTVSHELRTPLTSIRGSLGLLSGGVAGALPQQARELVTIADNNCGRLIRLVNDILDTEKIASGKMRFDLRPTELAPLVSRAVEAVAGFARKQGVELRTNMAREPITCEVDGDRMIQVLTNLISNAVKFSPTDIPVDITLSREGAGAARIEVRDHGSGIPVEFRPRIFQRFSQADASDTRQKAGTGLGLSIAKGIMDKLRGEIGFRTTEGDGTTFFVILPTAASSCAQSDRELAKET